MVHTLPNNFSPASAETWVAVAVVVVAAAEAAVGGTNEAGCEATGMGWFARAISPCCAAISSVGLLSADSCLLHALMVRPKASIRLASVALRVDIGSITFSFQIR